MNEEIRVNDGSGLYDNEGLIDSLIVDCNTIPKALMDNQYVRFCNIIVQMVQKLSNLKNGVKMEKEDLINQLAERKKLSDELAEKAYGVKIDKGDQDA